MNPRFTPSASIGTKQVSTSEDLLAIRETNDNSSITNLDEKVWAAYFVVYVLERVPVTDPEKEILCLDLERKRRPG